MKLKILRTLAAAMMVMLCAVMFAVAADKPAPLAPTPVRSVQKVFAPSAPATVAAAEAVRTAKTDRAVETINGSVIEFSMTVRTINADAHDNRIIGRHSETNELMTISPPNVNQSAFNPTANPYLIKPVPKRIVTGEGNQRFYRRE